MIKRLFGDNIGIVGGGEFCRGLLDFIFSRCDREERPAILGVADVNEKASGYLYAKERGLFVTTDYTTFYALDKLQVIIELTRDLALADIIEQTKPASVRLIDHFEAATLWDTLQIADAKEKALSELDDGFGDPDVVSSVFTGMVARFESIIHRRDARMRQISRELMEHEWLQSQIVQGSTIPTFVINKDHIVTHWNRALERLTGYPAYRLLGTRKHSFPFWEKERPTMADVILDRTSEAELEKLYARKWRKSPLIEGAFEAEMFFPQLGEEGKWCWFTAAPIKAPDGEIIGAIETLWDKTEDKRAEEQKERHTAELAALISIYTALNAPGAIDERINAAIMEIHRFLSADSICIYLIGDDGEFHMAYQYGGDCGTADLPDGRDRVITNTARSSHITVFTDLAEADDALIGLNRKEGLTALAYIPLSAKEKQGFGVIRVGSRTARDFSSEERHVLELIGNRIGVAVENAMLQEQYIKSEKKYRSLFDNDPNPIFILDSRSFAILDTNQRAQDYYGYTKDELCGKNFLELGDREDREVSTGLSQLTHEQSLLFSKKRHYKKDNKSFFVNINASLARFGEPEALIVTTTDITESVEKETQLIQAGKMTTLGVMAAGMAHEINQPLNVIQICADFFIKMLNRGQQIPDEELRSLANDIVENVERASGIIKHVRDFARQSDVKKSPMNINDPIRDVFKVMGHQLKVHRIELEMDLAEDLPLILAQHNRLEQVFINLVNNAVDTMDEKSAMPEYRDMEKKLTICTFLENGQVTVTVRDTGMGMPEEVKNKIFEPFFTTKKIGKGTGLGISISYGIIKDYEGGISIETEPGKGTTFKLRFPAQQGRIEPED